MNSKDDSFYGHLKKETAVTTPPGIDERILLMAKKELSPSPKYKIWLMPATALAASLVLLLTGSMYLINKKKQTDFVLMEPSEMILNYDQIELMADASMLSDADWETIESVK